MSAKGSRTIQDLPPEVLSSILRLLRPSLEELLCLSWVCSSFRAAATLVPLRALHIPIPDGKLKAACSRGFAVTSVCSREPAMFVGYQIEALNLTKLETAELVSNDYVTGRNHLSPHYLRLLERVTAEAGCFLKHMLINMDLARGPAGFTCVDLVSSCKNLTFLSVAFKPGIELEQKVTGRDDGRIALKQMVNQLPKLRSLYIFSCPTSKLEIGSESLERLHIYKSEFAAIKKLDTPNLAKLVFHSSSLLSAGQENIFSVLRRGCPRLKVFNGVDLGCLKGRELSEQEWCYQAMRLYYNKYQSGH